MIMIHLDGETFFLYPWQVLTIEENSNITFSQNCKIRIYGKLQIGSGTHIHIDPDADFEVYGIIKAHNVTFTGKHIIFDNTDSHSWVPIPNVTFSWTLDDERYSDFTNCTFQNTYYDDLNDNVYGGSIYVRDYFNIRFINCSFNNNRAKAGGAIAVVNSSILVNKCFFSNNESQHGGAIYSEYSSLNISQNQFVQNISTNKGGAIYTVYISDRNDNDLLISTNYFDRNHSSRGGAVSFNESQGKLLFINNSLINNTSNYGNGYSISHYYPSINDMYINNIIWKSNYQQAKDIAHRSRHLYFYPENSNLTFINNYIQGDDFGICGNVDLNIGDYDGYDNINIINDSYKINNLSNCYNTGLPYNNLVILLNEYNRQNIFNTNHNLLYEDIESKIRNLNKIEIGAYEVIDTGLNLNDTSVSFSSSTPGVTKKISIVIANTDSNNNININDVRILDSNFKIISHPNVVNINSYSTIDISFTPQKMFNNYNTKLQIYSNDPLNPLIEIPVSGNSFLHSGWNWISLPTNSINIDNFTNELNPYGVNILGCDGSLNFINDNWVTNGFTSLNNKKLYKINMSSTCSNFDINFTPTGITNTNPNITLYPNVDNWVGYWKSNPQNIDIAFGSNFDMVLSIKAENWYYTKPQQIIRNGLEAEPLPSHKIRPLHFGKGYIVRVSSIIRNFNWNSTNIISSNSEQIKPSYFTYNDSNEYRVVDIININDDIQEIGAFIEDTCIGASTVENGNAQILLYDTLNKDDFDNIHFQTYTNNKQNHTQSFYYFNNITNLFEKKISINNNLDYYLISFSKVVGEDVPSLSILMNVYPNPFTKSLNIDYQSKTNDKIKVSIYNIKGQKVKYLYDGNIKKGSNKFNWNAEDSKNNLVSSGIYFVKITNSKQSLIKKIIYLR
ncbi:MAG: T9SS type A sorting domain-containing protein [Candidatus Cloacimonetes bacterium]|nr:T9SS type A sorting domain-containing protein [Candidatus Cloacimonadota bacterium]